MMKIDIYPHTLHFKQPAGTSRGVYTEHKVWFLRLTDSRFPDRCGWGEVAPLPQLSCDDVPDFESILTDTCHRFQSEIDYEKLRNYPSILFGLECALDDLRADKRPLYDTPFCKGEESITINGLIWMGSYEEMRVRIKEKLAAGFHCIKVKIGAIDFEKEYALLQQIRQEFSPNEITLRVDANGGFTPQEALNKLERLAKLDIHSIEQPIKAGQIDEMAKLCQETPLPITLDEELIGVNDPMKKAELLDRIHPQYIIIKPSLHGGKMGGEEWIHLAQERKMGYWITSALESNIGLMHIAQWASTFSISIPQGLGTGGLYTNNIETPLELVGEKLWYRPDNDFTRFPQELEKRF